MELQYLLWVTALTTLLWLPYILTLILKYGPIRVLTYRADGEPLPEWAARLRKAHFNAVENLVIFAAVVFAAQFLQVSNDTTLLCAQIYFWARVAHVLGYISGLPLTRTVPFIVAWGACFIYLLEVLSKTYA